MPVLDLTTLLGWAFVHSIWQGVVVWLVYRLARLLTARPTIRYVVGNICILVFALAQLTTFTFFVVADLRPDLVERLPLGLGSFGVRPLHPDEPFYLAGTLPVPGWWAGLADSVQPYLAVAGVLWAICLGVRFLQNVGALILLERELKRCAELTGELRQRADAAAAKLGLRRPIRFLVSASASVPATAGWLKPVVLVPTAAMLKMSTQDLEALIYHELAHIARNDYLAHLFRTFVDAIYFYHPALRNVMRHVIDDAEAATDEVAARVFGERKKYASALVLLEERRNTLRRCVLGADHGSLELRLRNLIANHAAPPRGQLRLSVAGPFLLAMMILTALSQTVASAATQKNLVQRARTQTFQSLMVNSISVDRDNPAAEQKLERAIAELRQTNAVSTPTVLELSKELLLGVRSDLILSIEGVTLNQHLVEKLAPTVHARFGSTKERRQLIRRMYDAARQASAADRRAVLRGIVVLGCLDPGTYRAPTNGSIFNNIEFVRSLQLSSSQRRKFDIALLARSERGTYIAVRLFELANGEPPSDAMTIRTLLTAFALTPEWQLTQGQSLSLKSHHVLASAARAAGDPDLERSLARLLREADLDMADPERYPRTRVVELTDDSQVRPHVASPKANAEID